MLVVGDQAPHEDAVVECNSKLDPTQTSFLKMADGGGQPQITQPGKLAEAFKYFVQGMGYIPHVVHRRLSVGAVPSVGMTRLSRSRTTSLSGASVDGSHSRSRTLSQGSDGGQLASSPSQTMEVSC
ncbi:protein NDRG2-like [Mobula birostris]